MGCERGWRHRPARCRCDRLASRFSPAEGRPMKLTIALLVVASFAALAVLSVHAGNERKREPGFIAGQRSGPSLSLVPGVNQRVAKPTTAADENIRFVTVNVFIDTRTSA